ncbi:MAG: ABC transporter permease, partial [Acidimicrobiales bacterium]
MGHATLKSLLARKLRLALTALSVVLGVAFVAGTFVLTDTLRQTLDSFFASLNAGTDVSVRSTSGFSEGGNALSAGDRPAVPAALVAVIASLDGVAAAEGTLVGYAEVVNIDGPATGSRGVAVGTAWLGSPGLSPFTLRSGRA